MSQANELPEIEELEEEIPEELEIPEVSEEEDESPPEDSSDDREAMAKRQGWVPKEKYRGDPKRWVDADAFLKRGEEELPILRERLRRQDEQITEMQSTFAEFSDYHTKTVQKQYQKAFNDLVKQQREAVESADTEMFDRTQEQMRELQDEYSAVPVRKTQTQPVNNEPNPVYVEWTERNDWYKSDEEATAYANAAADFIAKTKPNLVGTAKFLDAVKDEVVARFPNKFNNPKRNDPPSVEGGGIPANRGKKKGYADLPASARATCDKYMKQGLIKNREQYVADYFEE